MGKKIRYGMVGGSLSGLVGEWHRKGIALDPRAELVAGNFSRKAEANEETGDVYGVAPDRLYSDYKEMIAGEVSREDGIDFVSIVTPNNTHFEISKAFLEAGINVVCDKPLTFEVSEAEELARIAKEKNLVFGVTYTYTGHVMVKAFKEMIAAGKIGEIISVNAEYIQDGMLDGLASSGVNDEIWRTDPRYAGIAHTLGDIGTHIEANVRYITGLKIKRVLATSNRFGHALDLNSNILVEYENGVNGSYWCSQVAAGRSNGFLIRVFGTEGAIEWSEETLGELRYTVKGQPPQILSSGGNYITEPAGRLSRLPEGHAEGIYEAFANIYGNIITTIIKKKNGETPSAEDLDFPTADDGAEGVRFVHAVVESAARDAAWIVV
ncbi:MAG: Gfo/Idh/MocA family oxidoreductase [Clostridiales Family XIII bacterium]|jgi:predicted dehydrogenase|nr:Gfo/Idh/MocA family oxidoreductase [Clostridiales Family XIII bacterium]